MRNGKQSFQCELELGHGKGELFKNLIKTINSTREDVDVGYYSNKSKGKILIKKKKIKKMKKKKTLQIY